MKKIITLLITYFTIVAVSGQAITEEMEYGYFSRIGRAERNYQTYDFNTAIKHYEGLINRGNNDLEIKLKLAESYRMARMYDKAEQMFAEIISKHPSVEKEVYYDFAEVLKINVKYEKAAENIITYYKKAGNSTKAAEYKNMPEILEKLREKKKYFTIRIIENNSEEADFSPAYYNDKLVFVSGRKDKDKARSNTSWNEEPYLDLYICDTITGNADKPKTFIKRINTSFHEGPCVFNSDTTEMFFTRNNFQRGVFELSEEGTNNLQVYQTQKEKKGWQREKLLPFNNNEYSCGHPALSPGGNKLYFSSDMPGGKGGVDIYVCTRNSDGDWGEPKNLGNKINTERDEAFPFVHPDGTLYFASTGHIGYGGYDIFYAEKQGSTFAAPENFGYELNTSMDDFGLILDKNCKTGYFASNREGDDNIYKITIAKYLEIIVKDERTKEIIPAADIAITINGQTTNVVADAKGEYLTESEPDLTYEVTASKDPYKPGTVSIVTDKLRGPDVLQVEEIFLNKGDYVLEGLISYRKTNEPVPGVNVTLIGNSGGDEFAVTENTGDFSFDLEADTDYDVKMVKDDYLPINTEITTKGIEPGVISIHEFLDDSTFVLEDLYYDFDKWNIRPDAAKILDKLIMILNTYPDMKIELGSHTDCRGSDLYNERLAQRRADSAVKYIIKNGIDKNRIVAKGYGEYRLVNHCSNGVPCSAALHQANRRTEVKVIDE